MGAVCGTTGGIVQGCCPATLTVVRRCHAQAHPTPILPPCLESNHLPNPDAIMNDRVNRMEPEQYPPSPALRRNENPPYPRLIGTDYKNSIFKVESQESQ